MNKAKPTLIITAILASFPALASDPTGLIIFLFCWPLIIASVIALILSIYNNNAGKSLSLILIAAHVLLNIFFQFNIYSSGEIGVYFSSSVVLIIISLIISLNKSTEEQEK
ncbi:hypothetical protein OS175_12435 [Marinicella sp. S1101]|uniref:hypothetical protein n=1 Tax=Marinicella marina TaxID=2996016 RepID=UPI002260AD56|nr:hypothetical protein [Marinicella marina]MCX7554689.1 hypothetical protein [Marinicella marina]MDJ1141495.1 hypothetical protein [Marinicella marina]